MMLDLAAAASLFARSAASFSLISAIRIASASAASRSALVIFVTGFCSPAGLSKSSRITSGRGPAVESTVSGMTYFPSAVLMRYLGFALYMTLGPVRSEALGSGREPDSSQPSSISAMVS